MKYLIILFFLFASINCIAQKLKKTVVLTFDDAPASHYSFVAPLLKSYGFGATFYVCEFPGVYPDSNMAMTWTQIGKLGKMGFEIGNHTWHHKGVKNIKSGNFNSELEYIERKIDSLKLPKMKSFCYPAYTTDSLAITILKQKGYTNARTGGERPYDSKLDDPFYIPSYTISNANPALFYQALKDAEKSGGTAIFCFHSVPDLPHPWVSTEQEQFSAYMKYLKDNGYKVIGMRDLEVKKH